MPLSIQELTLKSLAYRKTILKIIHHANAGHTGGSLSCIDILNVLYNRIMNIDAATADNPDRDRYIQSKGHAVEALYTVLADKGFFPENELQTLGQAQSAFIGHPTRKVRGIEHNTGALGHGLSVAVGLALAGKQDMRPYRVFALLGDGELTEGSNWEAAMLASHYRLDNLTAIVDRNGLQITGPTEEVVSLEPLEAKFAAFGFAVRRCDGNSIAELVATLEQVPFVEGRPSLIIASTVKGKGVSFIEHQVKWHHRVPSDEELCNAIRELDAQAERLKVAI